MIDSAFLRHLKKDVILINTSRGDVIDERAILAYLSGNSEAKLVLDVWSGEPEINPDLLARANIGTAHIAGYSMDSKFRAVDIVCRAVCEYFNIDYRSGLMQSFLETGVTELPLSGSPTDQDAIQMAVLASYDVRSDSSALRQSLELEAERRGKYFDELRSQYRIRREFDSLLVNLSPGSEQLAKKLSDLGFSVTVDR